MSNQASGYVVDENGNILRVQRSSPLNIAASQTDSVVVTGTPNCLIRVLWAYAVCGGTATTITFKTKPSGSSTAITPALANGANGGELLPRNQDGWCQTDVGDSLVVTTGAGSATGLQVGYVVVPATEATIARQFNVPNVATFEYGEFSAVTFVARGTPYPVIAETGTLPSGVTFNASSGVLSGTPDTGSNGTYPIVITADNGVGDEVTMSFTLIVTTQAPDITNGPATTTGEVGVTYAFTYAYTGAPTPSFSVSSGSLPTSVTLSSAGVISGTPTVNGTFTGVVTASNGVAPIDTQAFSILINEEPTITSASSRSFLELAVATPFTVTATGLPTPSISETGTLPTGVTFNAGTGVLSGTPAAGETGSFPISFVAANGIGTNDTQAFTLLVTQAPIVTSANNTTFNETVPGTFNVTATGTPAPSFTRSGTLPSGVTFNTSSGVLAGTPAGGTSGTYNLTFVALNGISPNSTQAFVLTVGP